MCLGRPYFSMSAPDIMLMFVSIIYDLRTIIHFHIVIQVLYLNVKNIS
jgi:hypothetical protein